MVLLLLTAIDLAIIFLREPPPDAPLNSSEIARLLEGRLIAKTVAGLHTGQAAADHPRTWHGPLDW